jgi:hypothetical protein
MVARVASVGVCSRNYYEISLPAQTYSGLASTYTTFVDLEAKAWQVGMVTRMASVGGCSGHYESRMRHECLLILGITMMKCCRPGGYPGAGQEMR